MKNYFKRWTAFTQQYKTTGCVLNNLVDYDAWQGMGYDVWLCKLPTTLNGFIFSTDDDIMYERFYSDKDKVTAWDVS